MILLLFIKIEILIVLVIFILIFYSKNRLNKIKFEIKMVTDEFLSIQELKAMVGDNVIFEYYDLKNMYNCADGIDNNKYCYDCFILLKGLEKYRCKEHAKLYSRVQSKKYINKYQRKSYTAFTEADKDLLLKFK